jgi:hypothetical protein
MCTEYTKAPTHPHQVSFTYSAIKSLGQQQPLLLEPVVAGYQKPGTNLAPEWVFRVLDAAPNPLRVSLRVSKLIIMVTIKSYTQ